MNRDESTFRAGIGFVAVAVAVALGVDVGSAAHLVVVHNVAAAAVVVLNFGIPAHDAVVVVHTALADVAPDVAAAASASLGNRFLSE